MSWAEIKKAVNSDLSLTLDNLIKQTTSNSGYRIFTQTTNFTIPEGVYKIFVTLLDGGSGGGARSAYYTARGGNGGNNRDGVGGGLGSLGANRYYGVGGGGSAGKLLSNYGVIVIPNETYEVVVGAGGAGGASGGASGSVGGYSSLKYNNTILADTSLSAAVRLGSGGNGGEGYGDHGGGGGGGGGYLNGANGNNADSTYGDGGAGGAGGTGIASFVGTGGAGGQGGYYSGYAGGSYGAGGGGSTNNTGASGAPGIVIITWGMLLSTEILQILGIPIN